MLVAHRGTDGATACLHINPCLHVWVAPRRRANSEGGRLYQSQACRLICLSSCPASRPCSPAEQAAAALINGQDATAAPTTSQDDTQQQQPSPRTAAAGDATAALLPGPCPPLSLEMFGSLMEEALALRRGPRSYLCPSPSAKQGPAHSYRPHVNAKSRALAAKLRPDHVATFELLHKVRGRATRRTASQPALRTEGSCTLRTHVAMYRMSRRCTVLTCKGPALHSGIGPNKPDHVPLWYRFAGLAAFRTYSARSGCLGSCALTPALSPDRHAGRRPDARAAGGAAARQGGGGAAGLHLPATAQRQQQVGTGVVLQRTVLAPGYSPRIQLLPTVMRWCTLRH